MIAFDVHPQMLLRLVVAVFVGALVGYERERKGKPAGVRTHGMVCLGAALFTLVSLYGFGPANDPTRVAAMVVSGIGFLGAGAVLHQRESVHGLTTAASLWVTAAMGLAVGVGMIGMSIVTKILVFLLLRFGPRPGEKTSHQQME
ncbi:MAG: MgtC/SapB family protein [Blastocatellales bacterium]